MDVKRRLREARWHWWLSAAFFVGICLLPSGHIEASPGEIFRPPVWMAPMGWPLLAMGVLFGAAAFSERLQRRAWKIVFFGAGASLLFELALVVFSGSTALYSFWLGTDLKNRIFVDFELDVLAFGVLPMDLLLVALSFLVLWVRHGKPAPAETPLFRPLTEETAAPAPPASLPAPPDSPATAGLPSAAEAPTAGPPAAEPAAPASPLDVISPGPPAPPEAGTVQAAPAVDNKPAAPTEAGTVQDVPTAGTLPAAPQPGQYQPAPQGQPPQPWPGPQK